MRLRGRQIGIGTLAVLALFFHATTVPAPTRPITALAPVEIWADALGDLRGIAIDAEGSVYVADREGGIVTRIGVDRTRTIVAAHLDRPVGLAVDAQGGLLIAESRGGRVIRIDQAGTRRVVVEGLKHPRWLATAPDGTLFVAARGLVHDGLLEPDDESVEPEMIIAVDETGHARPFAGGFRSLQGLALDTGMVYAATRGHRDDRRVDGVILQIPVDADGSAGAAVPIGPSDAVKRPIGIARDRLGALFVTTRELDVLEDRSKRAIAKLAPDGAVTAFASGLEGPQGLAFDAEGHLFVADGHAGRVLRFRAPAPPVLSPLPAFTKQASLPISGITEPGARLDVFVVGDEVSTSVLADGGGAFALTATLGRNTRSSLQLFATGHGGLGLVSAAVDTSIVHDDVPPLVTFIAPAAGAHVRGTVTIETAAGDAGSQVASIGLSVNGQSLAAGIAPSLPSASAAAIATWDTGSTGDGAATLATVAIDRAGNDRGLSRVVLVDNTPPDTSIAAGPPAAIGETTARIEFSGTDNLSAPAELTFSWRLDGGPWSPFAAASVAELTALTEGSHRFEVKARDRAGNEDATPVQRDFVVSLAAVRVTILEPADGASVPAGTLFVRGRVTADRSEVGVAVNGMPATVVGDEFVALVHVRPGVDRVTAVATAATAATATHTIAIAIDLLAPPSPELRVSASGGVAPLTVTLTLEGAAAATLVELDSDGDGRLDFVGTTLIGHPVTFTRPGLYVVSARVVDARGSHLVKALVSVLDVGARDLFFRGRWAAFRAALTAGDIGAAVAGIVNGEKAKYRGAFQRLAADLAAVGAGLRDIVMVTLDDRVAEYATTQDRTGGTFVHFVYFMQDEDGLWKIIAM